MTPPPLAIVQARIASTRLPGKMLLDLGGKPLVRWATDAAIEAFGRENVVAATPASEENDELARVLAEVCEVFRWPGNDESAVLSRVRDCAHRYRWRPESVIVRITPDDPFKTVEGLRRVAFDGARLPAEIGGEAFTLDMLDYAWAHWSDLPQCREHLTLALFDWPPPPAPAAPHPWTIDTQADLDAARAYLATPRREVIGGLTFVYE